ncbi:MAG TPA: hypothetical protein VGF17_15490 [Phytomonospora sp.]
MSRLPFTVRLLAAAAADLADLTVGLFTGVIAAVLAPNEEAD